MPSASAAAAPAPLAGVRVVSIAINLPGPAAVARLVELGAAATTVLPPGGDPMQVFCPAYFEELHAGQQLINIDLKDPRGIAQLDEFLSAADLLITSSRPSALQRLGLDFAAVHGRHPQLCQVDIVGYPGAAAEVPGHDLTYQAGHGLVRDALPTTLAVDLSGAERAAGEATTALVGRSAGGTGVHRVVALSDLADALGAPVRHGITTPGALLGGGYPWYAVYPAADGHVAVACLEPHFSRNAATALGVAEDIPAEELEAVFATRSTADWNSFAREHDLPVVAVSGGSGQSPSAP